MGNELGNEVDKLKKFVCEKDENLQEMELKEQDLSRDIEHITAMKNSVELAKSQSEEYHNNSMSSIQNELVALQSKLDEAHQNEIKMQSDISELKLTTENLQVEMDKKSKAYETITINLEEKLGEETIAKNRIIDELEQAEI